MFLRPTTINACFAPVEDRPAPFGEIPPQQGERKIQIGACFLPVGERTAAFSRRRFGRVNYPPPFDLGPTESSFKFLFLVHWNWRRLIAVVYLGKRAAKWNFVIFNNC